MERRVAPQQPTQNKRPAHGGMNREQSKMKDKPPHGPVTTYPHTIHNRASSIKHPLYLGITLGGVKKYSSRGTQFTLQKWF